MEPLNNGVNNGVNNGAQEYNSKEPAQTQVQAQPQGQTQLQPLAHANAHANAQAQAHGNTQAQLQPLAHAQAHAQAQAQAHANAQAQAHALAQAQAKKQTSWLPEPAMVTEAKEQSKGFALWQEILIFIAVFTVAGMMIEGTLQTVVVLPALFSSDILGEAQRIAIEGDAFLAMSKATDITAAVLSNTWVMLGVLFSTVGLSLGVLIYCRAIERRSFASMGIRRGKAVKEYLVGALAGLVLLALAQGICVLTGTAELRLNTSFSAGYIVIVIAFLLGFLLQGFSEELLCRGYFMVSLARKKTLPVAVVVSSLAFSLLHLMNPGVLEQPLAIVNIFLFGAVAGIYMLKRGNIWGAAAAHSLWNFAQGNIFGSQVSGAATLPSVFESSQASLTEIPWANWINGGIFGLEGGLCVTVVMVAATVIVLLLPSKAKLSPSDIMN
jgi:membrane protease YdiL (CAAX protease family)